MELLDAIYATCEKTNSPEPFNDALAILKDYIEQDPHDEILYSRKFRDLLAEKVENETDPDVLFEYVSTIESILHLNAPIDFDSYMLFMEWNREPQKRFWQPRRHVLWDVCQGFQDLADDKLDVLIVSLPPRVGKSTTGVFAETWNMGRNPTSANVMSGHSDKLTKGFHMEALSIISDSKTYRFREVFPDSPLVEKSMADETIHLAKKGRFPSLTCRSVDGTLTGAVEVGRKGWLYCDDLVSDREEALSGQRMDKLYAAYLNQLRDRMLDGAKEVHVGTRWVPNDVIGRVVESNEGNPRCRVIVVPALNEQGESNFNYLYDLGFSTEYYTKMRDALEDAGEGDSWSAKYMGKPYWIGGLMFPEDELKYYEELPEGEPDGVIAVCDTKDRGADYAVQPVGYIYGKNHYIHEVICDNGLPEAVEPRLASCLARNNVGMARYESNSAGGRVADSVMAKCQELGHSISIAKKFSTENKETRILVDSAWIKEHCYFRREAPNADYKRFMDMLTHYTTEGRNKHDDAPDAMSMYKRFATTALSAKVEVMKRLF